MHAFMKCHQSQQKRYTLNAFKLQKEINTTPVKHNVQMQIYRVSDTIKGREIPVIVLL